MNEFESTEKVLSRDGFELFYWSQGHRENDLIVFLHPAFADHSCFYKQTDFFAKNYHVITVDMVGHGKSQPGKNKVTIERTSELISDIITKEGHKDCHLVGVSMGSLIAQDIAYRFPDRVKTFTVLGGYSIFGDNKEIKKAQSREMFKWLFLIILSMKRFRHYLASKSVIHPEEQLVFEKSAGNFKRSSFISMRGMNKVLRIEDHVHKHPLLILSGDQDLTLIHDYAKKWNQKEATSEFHIIKNAGHCANMDNDADFNGILASFIQRH